MRRSLKNGKTRGPKNGGRAFTLIELLVVIAIIVLLVSILAPAVMAAIRMAQATRSRGRIGELMQAAEAFKLEKKCYPGQRGFKKHADGTDYTGIQQLAFDLFGPDMDKPNRIMASCILSKDNRKSDLFDPFLVAPNKYAERNLPNSVSDRYGIKPMAILYYPARRGVSGMAQYVEDDNTPYLVMDSEGGGSFEGWDGGNFTTFIRDRRLGGSVPHNQGTFILLAAGMDRLYGTKDDIKNW